MQGFKHIIDKVKGGKRCPPRAPIDEIIWSTIGSFFGIAAVYAVGSFVNLPYTQNLFLVGSFGASAVLLYGIPLSPFAQPRNLIGGHVVSAIVGVGVYQVFSDNVMLSSALAVSLAVGAMHLTRTLHPPGGATALIAVIGGPVIHQLGFLYVVLPIGAGAVIMLVVALITNNLARNRHYPEYWW